MTTSNRFEGPSWELRLQESKVRRRDDEPRISDEEAARWAALLTVQANDPRHCAPPLVGDRSSAGDHPRASGAALEPKATISPGAIMGSQSADTAGVNDTQDRRLILNVDSETLGRVQLIVDREEGGLRILVGSESSSKSKLSQGKHELSEALSARGVRVQSLRFVTQEEVGTVLAQDRVSKKVRANSKDDSPRDDETSARRESRKKRKLNLVG